MLRISKIAFPGLGIGEFSIESSFEILGFEIAWYAVIITLGMFAAVGYVIFRAKNIGITVDDIIDYALFTIPSGIIGARLYYVIFNPDNFDSFIDIINLRTGGLAIYGGIIAGALAVFFVSKYKKISFIAMADCTAPGVILAQAIGRFGNFTNGEAFGGQTEIFCRMQLTNSLTSYNTICVHPTFLYESLWNILGFTLLNIFYKKKQYDGEWFLMVFAWYGFGRMLIEGLRVDSLMIFGVVRVSQLLGGLIFAICTALLIYFAIKKPNKDFFIKQPTTKKDK